MDLKKTILRPAVLGAIVLTLAGLIEGVTGTIVNLKVITLGGILGGLVGVLVGEWVNKKLKLG